VSATRIWLAIGAITIASVLTRTLLLFVRPSFQFGPRANAALRYAPACALAAVVVPDLLYVEGALDLRLTNPRLVAGVFAVATFAFTRGTITTLVVGMAAYWLVRAIY
jgi:branched-subunit amino acid transport protein